MAFNPILASEDYTDDDFYSVIDRLKRQNALPQDSFIRNIPFFTFTNISKESQVSELFQDPCDPNLYKNLLKNIGAHSEEEEGLSSITDSRMMTFAQLCLYKTLRCPDPNCADRPREIVTHNQYKDYEYECPFYHHERDRRRIVISASVDEEFTYKANYFEDGRSRGDKDRYSQNYFESMFHPLYYKMFRCKREYCNSSKCCPFYHHEQEKKTWDKVFSNFIRKDRITYVKDKQKYYEAPHGHSAELKNQRFINTDNNSPLSKNNREDRQPASARAYTSTTNSIVGSGTANKPNRSPKIQIQNQNQNPNIPVQVRTKIASRGGQVLGVKKISEKGNTEGYRRKDSEDSFGLNVNNLEIFDKSKQQTTYRVC